MKHTFNLYQVRQTLVSSNHRSSLNWLFVPGGPGADASYFMDEARTLDLSGNFWLLDLPGNGNHQIESYDYDQWMDIFIPTITAFENPVLIGHSFGGMFPLLFPELENILSGFVILNSFPGKWQEAAQAMAKKRNLPDNGQAMSHFIEHPSEETFRIALDSCAPYYFTDAYLENGRVLLKTLPFSYLAAVWWQKKVVEINFDAKWIPHQVKTIHIGGDHDAITPFGVFKNDDRFNRPNIKHVCLENAGHFPWLDQPEKFRKEIHDFESHLLTDV